MNEIELLGLIVRTFFSASMMVILASVSKSANRDSSISSKMKKFWNIVFTTIQIVGVILASIAVVGLIVTTIDTL